MNIFNINNLYFLGICGTGMGNAALFFKQKGYSVSGSDNNIYPPMSDMLTDNDIKIHKPYDIRNIEKHKDDLFIIGNAISRGNPELEYILKNRLPYTSFPELLRVTHLFSRKSIVIAGTHGKTTTASLIAYIMQFANLGPDYIIGGIPINFKSGANYGNSKYIVLEGDEYDTAFFDKRPKFVHFAPDILVLTGIELDHTDLYKDLSQVSYAFHQLIRTLPHGARVIACGDYPAVSNVLSAYAHLDIIKYGLKPHNDFIVRLFPGESKEITEISLNNQIFINTTLKGAHNALNIAAAYLLSSHIGIYSIHTIKAISEFKGVKRRLELFHKDINTVYYDDFGHHPSAIKSTIDALRLDYPRKKIMGVFEPRTNTSRTNVFLNDYKESFRNLSSLIIFDNKALKEIDNPLDIKDLKKHLLENGVQCYIESNVSKILPYFNGQDAVVLFSSGSMDNLRERILKTGRS